MTDDQWLILRSSPQHAEVVKMTSEELAAAKNLLQQLDDQICRSPWNKSVETDASIGLKLMHLGGNHYQLHKSTAGSCFMNREELE